MDFLSKMNCLITKAGKVFEIGGMEHCVFCDVKLDKSLGDFLNGGIRIKINGEFLAIESGKPLTEKQITIINHLLRQNEIFSLIVSIAGVYWERNEYRRIKSLPLEIL